MLQQVTALKGLRIPHSGFRIPDSRFLPSTNPTDWQALKFVTTLTHPRTKFRLKKTQFETSPAIFWSSSGHKGHEDFSTSQAIRILFFVMLNYC